MHGNQIPTVVGDGGRFCEEMNYKLTSEDGQDPFDSHTSLRMGYRPFFALGLIFQELRARENFTSNRSIQVPHEALVKSPLLLFEKPPPPNHKTTKHKTSNTIHTLTNDQDRS